MKLPNVQVAVVPERKIAGYLLSAVHLRGRHKARYFEKYGFTAAEWVVLATALRVHAEEHEVASTNDNRFGTWDTIKGTLRTPSGQRPYVRSIGFIDAGSVVPRFVSAYPLKPPVL